MKITVYYEDNREKTTIEVPDSDCEVMIEEDYRSRLESVEDKSCVVRRTAQQIMDEECNKPTYNNHHAETRRHVSLEAYDPMGDTLTGDGDSFSEIGEDEIGRLYEAMKKLDPSQRRILRLVFFEGMKQKDLAEAEGITPSALNQRLTVILKKLKDALSN
ncbi:MAG: sigma-70 family RNA polymerase sigma factor [Clostridia bacterium]|nr:sigma-70 family RNA polymerase sigma factor [Clostridia bacterium]